MKDRGIIATIIEKKINILALISSDLSDGTSLVSIQLAKLLTSYLGDNKKILIINLSGYDLVSGHKKLDDYDVKVEKLNIITGYYIQKSKYDIFYPDPNALLSLKTDKSSAREWLHQLNTIYKYILIDMPAYNHNPDSMVFISIADAVVLVINSLKTSWHNASNLKKNIDRTQTDVIGVILNKKRYPIPDAIYSFL